jgi:hypothetical protein
MHDSHKWDRILNSRTASGRLSWSPGPELQDFPREVRPEVEEVLEKWREAFPGVSRFLVKETGAPEGTGPTFPDIDYAELEMRTLAHSFDHEDPRNIVGDGGALSGLSDDQRAAIAAIQKEFAPARIKPEGRGAPYGFSRKSAADLGATPLLPAAEGYSKRAMSLDDHVNNAVLAAREHLEELAGRHLSDFETYALNDVISTFAHGLAPGEGEE